MKTMTQSHTPKNGICKVCIIWLLICLCWCELCTSLHRSHSSKFSQLLSSHLLISPQVGGKLRTWRKDIISLFMLDQSTEQQASSTRMQSLVQADADLQRALATAPIAMSERVFLINGWRWHTMSVIRDLNRLLRVMQRSQTTKSNSEQILPAADFVLKFNYQALADIERNLFHPWLLQQLPTHISASYVFKIQDFHLQIEQLSKRVFDDFQVLSRTSAVKSNQQGLSSGNDHTRSSSEVVWHSILMNTKDMIRCAENIQIIQDQVLVPMISAYVPKKEQDRFNRKVLLGLGLINSQIHLVSMYETIKDNPNEYEVFKKQIPAAARLTLPLWKGRLYHPRAKYLE